LLKQHLKPHKEDEPISSGAIPQEEINLLAQRFFRRSRQKKEELISRLQTFFTKATDKDFLVIHSPGGWGNSQWEGLLEWEKSIVTGVTATLEKLGYSYDVVQYFRSRDGWERYMRDILKEARFFLTGASPRAQVMSEELSLIVRHLTGLKIILVGASQGAAFNNAAMRKLGNQERVYSIELGTFFPHMPRRIVTERTLVIDSNGLMRDPMCQRDLWAGTRSYIGAFYRWFKSRAQGKPMKFTHCINTPGHEYQWEYPAVHANITEFLTARFGMRRESKPGR
jgi:hypothetical protein